MNTGLLGVAVVIALFSIDPTAGSCPSNTDGVSEKLQRVAPAECGRYPYVASLRNPASSSHECGGILIHPRYVLTSATCIRKAGSGSIEVNIGGHGINDAEEVRTGTGIPNDSFMPGQAAAGNDIGLVKLNRALRIQTARLPNSRVFPGNQLTAIGWGRMCSRCPFSSVLNEKTNLQFVPGPRCDGIHNGIRTSRLLCAGFDFVACKGDEGSGLLRRGGSPSADVVVGVALSGSEFGLGCGARGRPGLYTDVHKHIGWIRGNLN